MRYCGKCSEPIEAHERYTGKLPDSTIWAIGRRTKSPTHFNQMVRAVRRICPVVEVRRDKGIPVFRAVRKARDAT